VTVVELRGQILRITYQASHPSLLTFCLIAGKIQSDCLVVQKVRFVSFFIEKTHPKQIFSITECFGIEIQDLGDELHERDAVFCLRREQICRLLRDKCSSLFAQI